MKYSTFLPPAHLSRYVRFFWVLEGEVKADAFVHHAMADGSPELLFHYNGKFDKLSSSDELQHCFVNGIQGQSQQHKRFSANATVGIFGVYLYPFAIPELFSIPATAVTDELPDMESFFGKSIIELEEKIQLASTTKQRIDIIVAFLESRLAKISKPPPGITEIILEVMSANGNLNVSELAERNFLSIRQFERNFKNYSGFSPKLFTRISRFQNALQQFRSEVPLTQIAYDAGYYDQSHFIKDFKEFSGKHPKTFSNEIKNQTPF